MTPNDPWKVKEQFTTTLRLANGRVIDEYDEGGEAIQVFAHTLSKLPDQRATLTIEFQVEGYYERDWPNWTPSKRDAEWTPIRAYLLPSQQTGVYLDRPGIRIRPSLVNDLFETFLPSIKDVGLDLPAYDSGDDDDYYRHDESVQQVADIITEDPDIFTENV